MVWISTRGASGSGTPGYSLYIDDLVITDVTDAKAAQDASDATASAVSGLTARVTDAEGKITARRSSRRHWPRKWIMPTPASITWRRR